MKGDFSRFVFDPKKHYARVLKQQGRLDLDADWNEQIAILLHRMETMAADLIGPFGGPRDYCGFEVTPERDNFKIAKGRYYVDGMLCENDADATYINQPYWTAEDGEKKFKPGTYVVYLDAWEEYVNAIEDPGIMEKALGGVDTAGRSKVVWRVIAREFNVNDIEEIKRAVAETKGGEAKGAGPQLTCKVLCDYWQQVQAFFHPPQRGRLSVQTEQPDPKNTGPSIIAATARYRGTENQLYRVEVRKGGNAAASPVSKGKMGPNTASFAWSRENGSVVFPVASVSGEAVTLRRIGGDATLGLKIGDWVELVDGPSAPGDAPAPLMRVENVKPEEMQVIVAKPGPSPIRHPHPYLRRWDQKPGTESRGGLILREDGEAVIVENRWLDLEDGIQIRFEPAAHGVQHYRTGDYWYVPARTADEGKIDWPRPAEPDGIEHRYAPLAILYYTDKGFKPYEPGMDCVMRFDPGGHFGGKGDK